MARDELSPIAIAEGETVDGFHAVSILDDVLRKHLEDYRPEDRRYAVIALAQVVGELVAEMDSAELETMVAQNRGDAGLAVNGLHRLCFEITGQGNIGLVLEQAPLQ